MTDSEYNCFSCKNSECKFHETQKPISYLDTPISSIIQIFTSDKGCASHSSNPSPSPQENDIFKMCWDLHDELTDEYMHLNWEEICGTLEDIAEASKSRDTAIRNATLDIIRKFDECCCPHEMCYSGAGYDGLNCRDCVIKFIEESLRSIQPQEPKP